MAVSTMEPQVVRVWTYDELFPTLARIVRHKADHIDPKAGGASISEQDGTPSCLVGALVYKLDPGEFSRIVGMEWDPDAIADQRWDWAEDYQRSGKPSEEWKPFEPEASGQMGFKRAATYDTEDWYRDVYDSTPGLTVTPKAYKFLEVAQKWQDSGNTWAESLEAAVKAAEEIEE